MNEKDLNRDIIENSYYLINLFLIDKTESKKISITNLKLQKLMYFVEAYYMVKNPNDDKLFTSTWSAWDYGPVSRDLYNYYKKFGSIEISLTENQVSIGENLPPENKKYIDKIYSLFGNFSAFDLVTLTHLKGSPWSIIYESNKESKKYNFENLNDSVISKKKTKEWFEMRFNFLFKATEGEE